MTRESSQESSSNDTPVTVPTAHWEDLQNRDPQRICKAAGAELHSPGRLHLPFMNEIIVVDMGEKRLYRRLEGCQRAVDDRLLPLITLVYLLNAADVPESHHLVGIKELKDAHFFQGPHALNFSPLLKRYGNDVPGFRRAAEKLGGYRQEFADASYRFLSFPRIPVTYLLWSGDEEFPPPNMTVLFDRSVERHLSADAIWGLVHLINDKIPAGNTQ